MSNPSFYLRARIIHHQSSYTKVELLLLLIYDQENQKTIAFKELKMGKGEINTSKYLPTRGLELLDNVSDAQKKGQPIKVRPSKSNAEKLEPSNVAFEKGKGPQELKSNHIIAIKDVAHELKKEVQIRSGSATWKILKHRVPELDAPTHHTEAKALKKAIEDAYSDKSLDAASKIDLLLKNPNASVQAPIQAKNFEEYEGALNARGDALVNEFGPEGEIWPLVEELVGAPSKAPKEELLGAKALLQANIRSYIAENGVLPERAEVLDMAIERVRYIFPDAAKALPKLGINNELLDFKDSNIKLGLKDFPTAASRAQVEELAKQSNDGDFQKAMYQVWSNDKLMLDAYSEQLSGKLLEIEKLPVEPGNVDEQLKEKLKIFAPGTKLFAYLKVFNGDPGLTGESGGEYIRLIYKQLQDNPDIKPSELAQQAYLAAQKVEIARLQHRDPALIKVVSEPFPDVLVTQLQKEREINWVHVVDSQAQKGFLADLTGDRLKNKPVNADGFALAFEADADRDTFDFSFGRGVQRVDRGSGGDVKRLLGLMSKGNKTVQATLSKLINQNGIALPTGEFLEAAYNPKLGKDGGPSAIVKESNAMGGRSNFENVYTLRDAPNNKVICEYDFVRIGDQLMINGNTFIPINRDLKLRGDASFENYTERRKVSIELDRKDLEKGVIKPKFITPPTIELHIKPDWGKLAILAKEGRLNDFSA
jgi:hypothetical protein